MEGHDVCHVLEDFQVLDLQIITILLSAFVGLLKLSQIFKDIPAKLDSVKPGNSGTRSELHFYAAHCNRLLDHLSSPP